MQKYFQHPLTLIVLLTICAFIGLNEPLWDQDEAAYFGFSTEMIQSGNWVVPSYPLSEPHRKTTLHFWTSALFMKIFGMNHFAFRLANTIYFLLSGILVFALAYHLNTKNKKKLAYMAVIVFYSSIFLIIYQKIALTDIGLLFYSLLGLFSFWKVIDLNHQPQPNKKSILNSKFIWILSFWISVGLGVLQKGPPILILLGGVFFIFLLLSKNRRILIQFHPWIFLPLSLLPILIWGRMAWIATNGSLIRWMIDWYILKRTTGAVFGQSGPPGTYLVLFVLFLFPWSAFLFNVLSTLKDYVMELFRGDRDDKKIFLLSWVFSGWIFYELLPSKLPSYSLAVYPLLSILIAEASDRIKPLSKYLTILIGLVWMGFFVYLVSPQAKIFADGSWFQITSIVCMGIMMAIVLYSIFTYQSFEINKDQLQIEGQSHNNFFKIAIGMVFFHLFFAILYYPSLSNMRDYGSKVADLFFKINPLTNQFEGDPKKENSKNNINFNKDLSIIIHSEIRLPSIVTSLGERGISTRQIYISNSPNDFVQETGKEKAIYLAPQNFLEILQYMGHKPNSQCVKFYSYESSKNLDLCWFIY